MSSDPASSGPLADVASAIRMDIETRAERITLLATGIYVANTVPAILLGMLAGVWADRWPQAQGHGGLQCHARPAGAVRTVLPGAGPVVSRF